MQSAVSVVARLHAFHHTVIKSADKPLSKPRLMDTSVLCSGQVSVETAPPGRHVDCQGGNNRLLGINCKQVIETVSSNWSQLPEASLHR